MKVTVVNSSTEQGDLSNLSGVPTSEADNEPGFRLSFVAFLFSYTRPCNFTTTGKCRE